MVQPSKLPIGSIPSKEIRKDQIDLPTPLDYQLPRCGIDMPQAWENKKTYYYPSENTLREEREKKEFVSLFAPAKKSSVVTESNHFSYEMKSPSQKIAEFIEKTLQLVPEKDQEKAIELLFKFSKQELLPLCSFENKNTIKDK
jgi:hypothetical protein